MEIWKGMYGLKQAWIIANLEYKKNMEKFEYNPVCFTAGLWKHETSDTIFALVVKFFFVKYTSEAKSDHFLNALWKKYSITVDKWHKNI